MPGDGGKRVAQRDEILLLEHFAGQNGHGLGRVAQGTDGLGAFLLDDGLVDCRVGDGHAAERGLLLLLRRGRRLGHGGLREDRPGAGQREKCLGLAKA